MLHRRSSGEIYRRLHKWRVGIGVGGFMGLVPRQKDQIPQYQDCFCQAFPSNKAEFRDPHTWIEYKRHQSHRRAILRSCAAGPPRGFVARQTTGVQERSSVSHEVKICWYCWWSVFWPMPTYQQTNIGEIMLVAYCR